MEQELSRFEMFLFGAVATVLLTRGYLAATGYPQIGSGNLHIAHVLWGGLLMGVAIVALVIVPGGQVKTRAALLGGVGFGLFIDEVGKFLTKDVDYFFQPAIAVMYVVFVGFYLVVRTVLRRRALTDRLRLAGGLDALSDQVRGQLSRSQRDRAVAVLEEVTDPELEALAGEVSRALAADRLGDSSFEHRLTVWRDHLSRRVNTLLAGRTARQVVLATFVLVAVLSMGNIAYLLATRAPGAADRAAGPLATLSSALVTMLVIVGVIALLRERYLLALRILHTALVVNLLVSQVFLFASEQFGALGGFALTLAMLAVLRHAIREQERIVGEAGVDPSANEPARRQGRSV